MKKMILMLLSLITLSVNAAANSKVFISQVIEHPALDATTKGVIEGLRQYGFERGKNLDLRVESAQGSAALAAQIASKFTSQKPDIVVGVGTLSAQSFVKYAQKGEVKLAFSTVTDPVGSGVVRALDKPGNNTSGVSNFVALEPQIKLFQKLQPQLKNLGILYNPGESNSVSIVKKMEDLCPKFGVVLVKQTVSKTSDVAQAATKLASMVDAIFISNDNTALGALQSIIGAANKVKIPVYVSDTDAVKLGAVAALGPDQFEVGIQAGKIVARALKGEDIGSISVEFPDKTDLYINLDAAKIAGILIPEDLRKTATLIEAGAE